MDYHLRRLYKDYGEYSNYRNFPLDIDGLKPVERRVLLAAYKISRGGFVKSRQIDSYATGHYHPHGECLFGETSISLLDGTEVQIKDLLGRKSFWVYSSKEDGTIVPGLAHSVRITKYINTLIKITLDNNEHFLCTEDHLIMLRNGEYKASKDLIIDDSLMPLYRRKEDNYTYFKSNNKNQKSEKVCWMVVKNLINEDLDVLKGKKKYHVHHINNNRGDDRPENLDFIYYKKHASETVKNIPNETHIKRGKVLKQRFLNDKIFREKALEGLSKGREKMFSNDSPIREKIRLKNSKLINDYNQIYVKKRAIRILKLMLDDNIQINEENYEVYRKKVYNGPLWKTVIKKFESIENAIFLIKNNHKVKNIEIIHLENEVPVYDMSVEKYNNFALSCGVFVHNCYGTVVQMTRQGFLTGQGNFGSNIGVTPTGPAASRYTECKINQFSLDLAFKYVNFVNWIDTELNDTEPEYLPTMFPLCIMGKEYTTGIGFGYKTTIPCFELKDLKQRLLWLLGIRQDKPTIAPMTDCNILSKSEVLEELLTTGKAKIEVSGIIEINQRNNTVALRSWPIGKRFAKILSKFDDELKQGLIGYIDSSVGDDTNIVFQVLRERNRDKIFKDFVAKLKLLVKGSLSFATTVVDINRQVMIKPIDQMLLDTYNMFTDVNKRMLNEKITGLQGKINEYLTLEKIRPVLSECIRNKINIPDTLVEVEKKTGVPQKTTDELIKKYNISKLLTLITDTSELNTALQETNNNLNNIDAFVLEQYQEI